MMHKPLLTTAPPVLADIRTEPSILRRDVRAAIGPLVETLAPQSTLGYSSGVTVSAADRTFVATYVFVSDAVAQHVFAVTPNENGARVLSWAAESGGVGDAEVNRIALTIEETGLLGGPSSPECPAYATVPPTATPTTSVSPSARPSAKPSAAPVTVFLTAPPTTAAIPATPTAAPTRAPSRAAVAGARTARPTIGRTARPTAAPTTCLATGSACAKSAVCCSGNCFNVCR